MTYESYSVDHDLWYKKRKHIYYLLGNNGNCGTIIATYSLKTKRLLIKCANEHIPPTLVLKDFVIYCEVKGEHYAENN